MIGLKWRQSDLNHRLDIASSLQHPNSNPADQKGQEMTITDHPSPTPHEQPFQMTSNMVYGFTTGATGTHSDDHMNHISDDHVTRTYDTPTHHHAYDTIELNKK